MKSDIEAQTDEEKITYRYEITIKVPLIIKDIPSHITLAYVISALPYMIQKTLGEDAEVALKELPDKS